MENQKLEYHDFWEIFVDEYLPSKISNDWLISNEPFIEETVNSHYRAYELGDVSDKIIMRILSEVLLLAFIHFKEYNVI